MEAMLGARLPAQSLACGAPLGVRNIRHVTALGLFHRPPPRPSPGAVAPLWVSSALSGTS